MNLDEYAKSDFLFVIAEAVFLSFGIGMVVGAIIVAHIGIKRKK